MADAASTSSRRPLRLVLAAAELAPLAVTGGLGDAVAGLAGALALRGHDVTCLLPAWRGALHHAALSDLERAVPVRLGLPGGELAGHWHSARLGAVAVELLELGALYDRDSPYGGYDEGLRFVAFSRAAAARCAEAAPDVFVAHDWHAALGVCALRTLWGMGSGRSVGCVQVVHNNAHTGRYTSWLFPATGLPGELFRPDGLEFHGDLCLLKGGLAWADRIVAVSPSYAAELETPEHGGGLEGLYAYRRHRLTGIANGIDTSRYDPARDAALPAPFSRRDPAGRVRCREAFRAELGLEAGASGQLLAAVGRLAEQKGWDVLAAALPALVARGFAIALLGEGHASIADALRAAARRWPGRVSFTEGWDDALARRLYAGADALVVPSRFEPCGLVQLLAQRYGALPIAHRVGGLQDTIQDGETGILFAPLSADALVDATLRGAALVAARGPALVRRLLAQDVSWRRPAARWERVLAAVADEAAARA
jgi:starch synthase